MRGFAPFLALFGSRILTTCADEAAQEGQAEVCRVDSRGSNCSLDSLGERAHLYEDGIAVDIKKRCPLVDGFLTQPALWTVGKLSRPTRILQMLGLWPAGVSEDNWADEYVSVTYMLIVKVLLRLYKSRNKDYVNIPVANSDPADLVRVEKIYAPHWDVDGTPNFYWFESAVPEFVMKKLYVPLLTCFYSLLRRMSTKSGLLDDDSFDDVLNSTDLNTWDIVLKKSPYKTKLDWVMSFYENARSWDGKPLWPKQMTNFQSYWKKDEWDDGLEHAIAFHLIGSHRVEAGSWRFENVGGVDAVQLPLRVALNGFSAFEIRKHFGRYGGDLYFNEDGLPVLLQTPDGEVIARGDKNWQYWKFVWRSSLITAITLVDHLHMTHFRVSNLLARIVRSAMPPDHPMRRFMSIFSFGAIFVNMQAMHTLVGPNHLLHRATPFKNFLEFSNKVPAKESGLIQDVTDRPGIRPLLDDTEWEKLHPKLKEAPYFADGRLLMRAFMKLTTGMSFAIKDLMCTENDELTAQYVNIRNELIRDTAGVGYHVNQELLDAIASNTTCSSFERILRHRFAAYTYIVTAYHRHVGFVGDYYADPQLATMSWRDGEAFGRPKQHMIMTIINVFTSTHQPLLMEDYTHLFKGMKPDLETEFVRLWHDFLKDLKDIAIEVERRNEQRIIKNINGCPTILESAVSK